MRESTYNVDVIACVGNRNEFSVVREAERGDGMTVRNLDQRRISVEYLGDKTYSHAVMVRTHTHSDTSNKFTIESLPPDARYLFGGERAEFRFPRRVTTS